MYKKKRKGKKKDGYKPKGPSVWLLRITGGDSEKHRIFMFIDDTKDLHRNVPKLLARNYRRSWESMQIERKVADECSNEHMA